MSAKARLDAIVIGTGPAGGAAAIRLAESGARVLILERHQLPRDKACGGGLTPAASELLDWDISGQIEATVSCSRFAVAGGELPTSLASDAMLMVRRRSFDLHLVERALAVGGGNVVLNQGVAVAAVAEDDHGVTVIGDTGERWRASFVVGADGAAGITARSIGLARRTRPGVALDADIEVPAEVFDSLSGAAHFEFGCLPFGYGWIFPKNGYLSCGVGSWSGRVRLPPALDDYLARALPSGSILAQRRRGHPIPLYEGPARIASRRVCLAGDSASLVDPLMGEGIRFALWSGQIAAGLIAEQLAGETALDDGETLSSRVHLAFGASFDALRRHIQPILLRRPELFVKRFIESGGNCAALARALDQRFGGPPSPSFVPAGGTPPVAASMRNVQS